MSKAYTKQINQNTADSQQTNPSWMLTFVRWENRDTHRLQTDKIGQDLATRKPMVVINDCISVSVTQSKQTHTPSMQAILRAGDVNYETSVAPGDFVFVNMLSTDGKQNDKQNKPTILQLLERANSGSPINNPDDGFKGFFKIQSVRRVVGVDPQSGVRQIMFQIDGFSHTEFNNKIYFNPYLINQEKFNTVIMYASNMGLNMKELMAGDAISCQRIIASLISNFLGQGIPPKDKSTDIGAKFFDAGGGKTIQGNFNTIYRVPQMVGKLLGEGGAQAAKDLYVYYLGIQKYDSNSPIPQIGKATNGRFYNSKYSECQGAGTLKPDYWNQTPVWSIIQAYLNSPINEMYNSYRLAPNGRIMPSFTMRQAPFSTESFNGTGTKFLSLPRWKIDTSMIYDINIGRDEVARINFVQVFSTISNLPAKPDSGIAFQIAEGNYVVDGQDIQRNGLRPYVITSNFDFMDLKKQGSGGFGNLKAASWARLLADQLIGGHLKLNGSITCVGIQDPITIGDNLELDGVVYHIEAVTHTASIAPGGHKTFGTTLQLSNGIDKNYTASQPRYAEMENTDIQSEREKQYKNDRLFTGYSDEQMIPDRENGIKTKFGNNPFLLKKRGTKRSPAVNKIGKKVNK